MKAGYVDLHAKIKVRITEVLFDAKGERKESIKLVDTTVGRALLSEILPEGLSFDLINKR